MFSDSLMENPGVRDACRFGAIDRYAVISEHVLGWSASPEMCTKVVVDHGIDTAMPISLHVGAHQCAGCVPVAVIETRGEFGE